MSERLDSVPEKDFDPNRRTFLKFVAAGAVTATAAGMLPEQHPQKHDRPHPSVARAEADIARLAPELAEYNAVDLLGAGLFLHVVTALARGNSINKWHYSAMAALLAEKYRQSTPEQQVHLAKEIKSNMKTLGVIVGTVAIGDGLKLDLTKICEELMGKQPDAASQVALLNMFSSFVAPVVTTVGNASIIASTANRLAEGDKDFMAISIGHSSGRAGYLLFGDPPFLALIDKYGFKEAVVWQLTRMLPLALNSLVASTIQMNLCLAKRAGDKNPLATAIAQSYKGITENIPFLVKIITSSLGNAAKYFSGADAKWAQSPIGLEFEIGKAVSSKLENLFRLPWDKNLDKASSEDFEGMVADADDLAWRQKVEAAVGGLGVEVEYQTASNDNDSVKDDLNKALLSRDFVAAKKILLSYGIKEDEAEAHIANLKLLLPSVYAEEGTEGPKVSSWRALLDYILKAPARTTDVHRIKTAFGHNIGDVLNVFPFQANCVPFLLPLLQKFVHKLEAMGLSTTQKEIVIFLVVMAFSMVADNYVAVKMGLDLLPNKPQIPLVAGIEGGELSSIGNMANMAQFNSEDYSLKDSLARMHLSIEQVGVGLIYALSLGEASIRPTDADVTVAKNAAKDFLNQVLGNPTLQSVTQTLCAA
jgi:hypothetical protein